MTERFLSVLETVTGRVNVPVGDVLSVAGEERAAILAMSQRSTDVVAESLVAEINARAAVNPSVAAVVGGGVRYSYTELTRRADALAAQLAALGAGADDVVVLAVERSVHWVVGMLAAWKVGAGYAPVDPAGPVRRIESLVADTGAVALVARPDWISEQGVGGDFAGASVLAVSDEVAEGTIASLPVVLEHRQQLGYVISTSGSTGRPKPTMVPMSGVENTVAWYRGQLGLSVGEGVLIASAPTFDLTQKNVWAALASGATVHLADTVFDPRQIVETVAVERVAVMNLAPSAFETIVDADDAGALAAVRVLFLGGEVVKLAPLRALIDGGLRVVNSYGPTEACDVVSFHEVAVSERGVVPIGRAIPGVDLYVLTDRLGLAPVGVPGELYIGGVAVGRGYGAMPGQTADRFIADPFAADGSRLYRTGDLVRWNVDGELDYLGRTDFQIKLRGLRVELGEIESVLAAVPEVDRVATIVATGPDGIDQLVAYISPADVDVEALKVAAFAELPGYMVPTVWMMVEDIALSASGKVDRQALPPVDFSVTRAKYVAPETETESAVAAVFAEILGVERVSVAERFFDLGGNSLSAMRLAARASDALGVRVSIRDVFDAQSVRELAAAVTGAAAALPPIVAGPRPAQLPLSFAQQRMWFLNQFTESAAPAASYNIPFAVRLVASDAAHRIDSAAVAAAVHDVMARHETLRTRFRQADDGTVTAEIADAAAAFDSIGWAELSAADENATYRTAAEWATRPFDVAREFPVRGGLIDLGAGEVVLVLVLHHIAADGESMAPLLTDLLTAYAARTAGQAPAWEPLPVQYADYALWQRAVLGDAADASSIAGTQLDYWRDRLAGLPDVLDLPTDFARPAVATMAGGSVAFTLPGTVRSAVADLARAHGTTEFAVLHAAIASLLARLSGTDDIAVGTPIAGRGQSVLDPVVGMFVNTLVLRTRIDSGKSFADTVADTAAVDLAALSHSDVPFEHVVEAVNPVRSEAFVPLAQTLFTFDQHDPEPMAVDGLLVEPVDAGAESAKADLNFVVARDADGGYAGRLVFATDLFTPTTAQSIADRFVTLLTSAVASVSTPVGDIDLRSSAEVQAQAELPAPVCETVNADRSLVELFTAAATRRAAATAVTAQGSSVTYAALAERSDAIAAGLVARGVRAGDLVGVATGRSTDLVASILGVLKAGAAYVPLDTSNPAERLAFIVADSGVHVVLTDASVADHDLWSTVGASVSVLDVADLNADGAAFAPVSVPADAAAYVIYTSGSTGRPKGVVVSHRDVVTLMDTAAGDFEFRDDDVWTMFHSYAFDFTVWELWGPLLSGARLVIVDRDLARDPVAFLTLLSDEGVSVLSQTPSAFYQLSEARRDFRGQLSLRYVVFGGEELGFEQVRRWFDAFPDDTAQLVNMYGITETTVHVSFRALDRATVSAGDGSFIGRPLASLAIHILDDRMHPVPAGVPGEMYVSGGQLAHGYLHRSGLTSTRFVADPFGPAGSRLYRTGDLARRVGDDIEYLGRGDAQVQLRGFRIEYGEIEAALLGAAGVSGAAARVVEVPGRGELLIGYVVGDDGDEIDPSSVRSAVGRAVPGYMVPDQVVAVDTLPLTANGKLDRKALPIPESLTGLGEFVAPVGDIEAGIAAVFADVLGLEQVSVVESFFDLGGNSLSATRVVARVGQALDAHVSVRDLFTNPSVRELAATVDAGTGALAPITAQPRPDRVPLSFAQQRLWFLNRLNPGDATYNVPIALRLTGALDVAALRAAVVDVVARHEVLRTTFPEIDGEAFQLVHPIDEIESSLPWTVVTSREEIEAQATRGFDLTAQWPLRIVLWPISETEHVLAAISQHIAMDGESLRPLVTDVITAYAARAAGQAPAFAPLAVQFADFALWQHRVLGSADDPDSVVSKQLAYWTEQLAGLPGVLEFPTDRHRPLVASGRGANLMTALPATTAAAIVDYAHARRVTPFMVMHAALAATMSRIAGADDIAIATPVAGRGDAVLDPLVGMFVNTLVLRASVDGGAGFDALVRQVADTDVAAFAHADVPFEAVVDAVDPVRSEAFAPLAQVQLNFDPGAGAADSVDIAGLAIAPVDTAVTRAQLDLYLTVQTGGEDQDWNLNLIYATDLFDEPRIRRLLDTLVGVLDQVLADPMAPIGDLQILDESERRELEAFEHGPIVEFDERLLTEVIAEQVSVSPEAVALVFGEREVSYRE
ncbi:amino acid adenylation domain-containing protein, partial [Gordonia sp. (in: high G+C Gram-positive bacteria)]